MLFIQYISKLCTFYIYLVVFLSPPYYWTVIDYLFGKNHVQVVLNCKIVKRGRNCNYNELLAFDPAITRIASKL